MNPTNKDIPYDRKWGDALSDVRREIVRVSRENPGLYVRFHAVFGDGWFSFSPRFDRYMPGDQASRWLGGYALNGEFRPFTEKQIIWEANQGLLAE